MRTSEIIRGELERLFELDELLTLSTTLLGVDPAQVGGTDGKGTFAQALVQHCADEQALMALADAILHSKEGVSEELQTAFLADEGSELKTGDEIDGFRILKRLAGHGVTAIYLAERKTDDDKVRATVQVLHAQYAQDRQGAQRWQTFARLLQSVDSEHLAKVLHVGTLEDGRPWVATEYIDGQILSERVGRTGPLHFNEAKPIILGVLQALEDLHERNLTHGDVKSENVTLVRRANTGGKTEPSSVLTGGGSDRLFSREPVGAGQTGLVPLFGTAKTLSPERARSGKSDLASDLYAAGCLLYEMLSGRAPFEGETALDVIAGHLLTDAEPPSNFAPRGWVPKELDELVLQLIAKSPETRFTNVAQFRRALESTGRKSVRPPAHEAIELDKEIFDLAASELHGDPTNEEFAVAVERIVEPSDSWAEALTVFDAAVEKTDNVEAKKSLLFRAARIREKDLQDHEAAEATYLKILELEAENVLALGALEELKRSAGDAEGLVDLLLQKAEREDDAVERSTIFREIATLYEKKLDDVENGYIAWVQALAENPRDQVSAAAVERLAAGNTDRWNEAIGALNETVEATEEETEKVPLYVLMGRWYANYVGRPDFALPCFQQALKISPSNEAAMEAMIALYRKAQSWPDLVTILVQRADTEANPVRSRDIRAEAAVIVHQKLNQPEQAAAIFEQIVSDDPTHEKATSTLELIYAAGAQWQQLVDLLDAKSKHEKDEARNETLCALAEVYEDRLNNVDQAANYYEAALKHDATNLGALKGLERIYARTERFQELVDNLQIQLDQAATTRQKITLLERMASIHYEEFLDNETAARLYGELVAIDAGHEVANTALARIFRKLQRFDDLAVTLERHALSTEDETRKVDLLLTAARTLMVDIGAPERAVSVVERVLSVQPQNSQALEMAARLQAQTGDTSKALEATEKLAEAEQNAEKKANLYFQAAQILQDAGDNDSAITRLKRALDANPNHSEAAVALRALYAGRGDAHGAADLLTREIELASGDARRATLYAELGALQRERLNDNAAAVNAFEKALASDPTCTPAARGLGDIAFAQEDYTKAAKYYEPLLARTGTMEAQDARDIAMQCGDAFRALEQFDKAARAYTNARAFAKEEREVHERLASVTFEAGAADEAAELYRDILAKFSDELVGPAKGRTLWRMGEALRRSEQLEEAESTLKEATALMADDPAPLTSLRQLYETQEKWTNVIQVIQQRLDVAGDDERFDLLVAAGDVHMHQMSDRAQASKSYVAALELRADDRNLLSKLMAVYSQNKDWSRLVEVILRIAELIHDPKALAKYYNTAASICRHELERLDESADYYEQAVEQDPTLLKAFEGLVTVLNAKGDWKRLEQTYRSRIAQLGENAETNDLVHLWDSLGELLMHRLDEKGEATEAFEKAQTLDPGNRHRAEQLAEVYSADPKRYFTKAVEVHSQLLELNPYRVESYQALRKLYTEMKRPDQSWCVCQALSVLKMAEPDEENFYRKHHSKKPATAKDSLTAEQWNQLIVHESQNPLLTDIFAAVTPAVLKSAGQPLSSFGLDAANKRNAENDDALMARTLHYAAGVTGLSLPDLYYREGDAGGLSFIFSDAPSIGLGKAALAGGPEQALAFVAGRHLSYMRTGHFLRMIVPTGSGLRAWLLAAVRMGVAQFPVPDDLGSTVRDNQAAIKTHLSGPQQDRLRSLVSKLLQAAPELDMKRWISAVDLTADRIGFILSNSLELSTAVIRATPNEGAGLTQKERLKELHLYSVSDDYLNLRQKLGLAIDDN